MSARRQAAAVDAAGGQRVQAGDGAQQGGLAGAVGADQRGEAAGGDDAGQAGQDDPAAVAQFDVIKRDHSAHNTAAQTQRQHDRRQEKGGTARRRSGTAGRSWLQYNIAPGWTEGRRAPKQAAMTEPDPDALARRTLRKHRLFATGLLVLMAVLTLASYSMPPSWWSGLLQASAKAGFIGGIADWFAVTALFRHPLGIPIPHTAIIPNQRARLGQALGGSSPTMCSPARRCPTCWRSSICRASCTGSWLIRRRRIRRRWRWPACCRSCWRRWRTDGRAGCWRVWCRGSWAGRRRARWWPGRCTAWSMAAGTRRCSASSSGRLKTALAGREDALRHGDRGAGARTGRPAGRLGAGRVDRPAGAGAGQRRTG